jgi:hypothetical protein
MKIGLHRIESISVIEYLREDESMFEMASGDPGDHFAENN